MKAVQVVFSLAMAASLGIAAVGCDSTGVEGETIGYIDGVEQMNKSELISAIAKESKFAPAPQGDATSTDEGEDMATGYPGFGTWSVRNHDGRRTAAPKDGDDGTADVNAEEPVKASDSGSEEADDSSGDDMDTSAVCCAFGSWSVKIRHRSNAAAPEDGDDGSMEEDDQPMQAAASSEDTDSEDSDDATDTDNSGKGDRISIVGFGTWSVR